MKHSDYRMFRPTFRARDGSKQQSRTYHVEFKDHTRRWQRVTGYTVARDTDKLAQRLMELVSHKRNQEPLPDGLRKWLDTLPDKMRERLAVMDLLDATGDGINRPLRLHLDADAAEPAGSSPPGYRQELLA